MGLLASSSQAGMSALDHAVVGVYLALMLLMGWRIARRQRSTEDFFVGGRQLPAWAVGISLLASLLSTITYLGMPGEMFRTGVAFLTRQLGVPIVLFVVWFLWIPFFMRLKLTSAYEYLEKRFDYPTRAVAAVFCLLLLFGWISVVVLTASKAMAEIVRLDLAWFLGTNAGPFRDADMHAIILSIGLFSVLYTTLGGIRAVVWTDVIQFVILVGGAFFTMGYIAAATHSGVADWIASSRNYPWRESVEWFSWDVGNRSTVFVIATGMVFWFICTHGANQVALQRYFTVRDVWAARRSYLISALASFGLGVILAGVGVSLMHFLREHPMPVADQLLAEDLKTRYEAQDAVFPQFIRLYLPDGLRGLVVAALFAAAMSTIDSGANSVSTILTVDFFRRWARGRTTESRELRMARVFTASMGVVVVALTIFLYHISKGTNLIDLCQRGFNCFLGPLGALFVLAMFSRRATGTSVLPALFVGEAVGILTSYSRELLGRPFSTHLVVPTAWLATIVAAHLFSLLFGTEASAEQRRWMWWPVVRGTSAEQAEPATESGLLQPEPAADA